MGIEKEGFNPNERVENKSEQAPLKDQEKLEAYLGYLVEWKNEITNKNNEIKREIDSVYTDENMNGFFSAFPEKRWKRGADQLFTGLIEKSKQFEEIQKERNLWATQVSSTIHGSAYSKSALEHHPEKLKDVDQYFLTPTEGNEHLEKLIKGLGLNIYEHPSVAIRKDVLTSELPLYDSQEDEDSIDEKWLKIKDGEYIVESKHSDNDANGNEYDNEKQFKTYEEAVEYFNGDK